MKHSDVRRHLCCALAVTALSIFGTGAAAQERQPATLMFTGLFGTGLVDSELGLTGGVGAAVAAQRYVLRAILDLHLVQPDVSDYAWDLSSAGPECREEQTGAVVADSFCTIDRALAGISADASYIIPAFAGGIHLGAGYRIGSGTTPYGLAGYGFNPERGEWNLLFRLLAGADLVALQAVASLPIGRR